MIKIHDISFSYGSKQPMVFSDFSLNFEPGKIYGLLGKNGTGKSTLLYLVSGLLRADKGCILYNDMDVTPTNGLDIPSKSLFRKVVSKNMTDERTLIISTHQVRDVEMLIDHVVMLEGTKLLLNRSIMDICSAIRFEERAVGEPLDDALYVQPSMRGNTVIVENHDEDNETSINLEMLFNCAESGKLPKSLTI